MIVPAGVLQYNRSYVFRIMLEDLLLPGVLIANRSSTFSEIYTPVTVLAGDGFSVFSDRRCSRASWARGFWTTTPIPATS